MPPESVDRPEVADLANVADVDLLIEARWVLPMAPVNTVLEDHAVAVTSGQIVALGPTAQMKARFEPRERVVRGEHVLLPGFVNAHTRAATTLFRGLPVRGTRSQWLRHTVRVAEQSCISPDFVREGTQLAIAEMLRAGITTFSDMYLFPAEAAQAASAARMRAAIGLPVADAPNVWADGTNAYFEKAEQLWDEYRADPWICLYFAPQDAAEISDQTLIRVRRLADELDARVVMESPPLARLHEIGLLRPGFTAIDIRSLTDEAQSNSLRAEDIDLVVSTGMHVVACVQSDLRLGGGTSPLAHLSSQRVTLGLGTGEPASVGALDLLAEARTAALVSNGLTAEEALRIATLGGATALGVGALTGSIEVGKQADLVCIDLNRLACQPRTRVADSVLFGATREQVSDVWTSGRAAVTNGRLLAFDEEQLGALTRKWSQLVHGRSPV
jgi:5-methylthioadenosine/S-adenosylhomocysteine deaminase